MFSYVSPEQRIPKDQAYDVQEFIDVTRELGCTPHVVQIRNRPDGSRGPHDNGQVSSIGRADVR